MRISDIGALEDSDVDIVSQSATGGSGFLGGGNAMNNYIDGNPIYVSAIEINSQNKKGLYIVNTGIGDFSPSLFLKLWKEGDVVNVPTVRHAIDSRTGQLFSETYKVCEDIEIYPARDLK